MTIFYTRFAKVFIDDIRCFFWCKICNIQKKNVLSRLQIFTMSESTTKKLPKFFLPFFSLVAGVGPFAMDSYLPAVPLMAEYFLVDIVAINNTIPAYMVGYGIGQLFGGPISDRIGRKRVALIGLVIFMLATLMIVFASSIQQILAFRVLQALLLQH